MLKPNNTNHLQDNFVQIICEIFFKNLLEVDKQNLVRIKIDLLNCPLKRSYQLFLKRENNEQWQKLNAHTIL